MKITIPNTDKFFKITSYNPTYFKSMKGFSQAYELIFIDFIEYTYKKNDTDFLSFLKDSVENNIYLSDVIEERNFNVNDKVIMFSDNIYPNIGSFVIDNYTVNVCGSYTFIYDSSANKKYFYYGD